MVLRGPSRLGMTMLESRRESAGQAASSATPTIDETPNPAKVFMATVLRRHVGDPPIVVHWTFVVRRVCVTTFAQWLRYGLPLPAAQLNARRALRACPATSGAVATYPLG